LIYCLNSLQQKMVDSWYFYF